MLRHVQEVPESVPNYLNRIQSWAWACCTRCRRCSEHVQEGGGSSGTCSCYHPTNSANLDIESCARINMGRGLLLKDVHSKEKGVFGDLSSLSDFSELSQSHNRCRRWSKSLDFEVIATSSHMNQRNNTTEELLPA